MKFARTLLLSLALAPISPACRQAPQDAVPGRAPLFLQRSGRGSPTVVFEAGLGDASDSWRSVAPAVARFTGVVTYDRAGLGRSAASREPRTASQISKELHAALASANVQPPYVLVSHSAGAWYAMVFASRYPQEVRGLVMVDPTPVRFFSEVGAVMEPGERRDFAKTQEEWTAAASPGRRAEWSARDSAASEAAASPLPATLPVTILSAGQITTGGSERVRRWWVEQHSTWVRTMPHGTHRIIQAGHYIQLEQPDVVVSAVRDLLAQAGEP